MKTCSKCHKEKDLNEFYHSKRGLFGFRSICKKCDQTHHSNYIKNHKWKKILQDIKQRCNNPNNPSYKDYGEKGIKCFINEKEIHKLMIRDNYWNLNDPTIDRIDNNGNYAFENCQFLERVENSVKDKKKPILQFDIQGNFIKEWESLSLAGKITNINFKNISLTALHKRNSAGGFAWKYKENVK
jgi:hypothetical protein